VRPPQDLRQLAQVLKVDVDEDGFLAAREMRGGLIATSRPGIYAVGCATGPKDIPDSVAEASAAAAAARAHLSRRSWPEPPQVEPITELHPPRSGVFVCHCGSNIAGVVDVARVAQYARTLPDVVHAQTQMFSCASDTQEG
jgi:heterodisulfide reductase subunit A